MRKSGLALLGMLFLAPSAWGQSTSERVDHLEQQVSVMQAELNSLIAVQQANRGSQSALGDLVSRMQKLEQQMRELRGQVDDQNHLLVQGQQALDKKVKALAQQVAQTQGASSPTATTSSVAAPTASTSSALAAAVASAAANTMSSADGVGQQSYNDAFGLLKNGKYGQAVAALQDFIQKYPQSSLLPDAYFWLGQAQYVLGQYDAALRSLYVVQIRFPQSSQAPAAMLRMAEIYQATNQPDKARFVATKLIQSYPTTPSAQKAQNLLQGLPAGNH